jgi:hypothetical protein
MTMRWIFLWLVLAGSTFAAEPETVRFRSEDRQINLVGYLFEPSGGGTHAAVVMLHGRAGPYSSLANGVYTAATLSKRHKEWGQFCRFPDRLLGPTSVYSTIRTESNLALPTIPFRVNVR